MGGAANDVYFVAQTAYDAANALQVAHGGVVVLNVLKYPEGFGTNISLSAAWNSNVKIVGLNKIGEGISTAVSNIGVITTNGFSCVINLENIKIDSINPSGAIEAAGSLVSLSGSNVFIKNGVSTNSGAAGSAGALTLYGLYSTVPSVILPSTITGGIRVGGNLSAVSITGNGGKISLTNSIVVGSITTSAVGAGFKGGDVVVVNSILFPSGSKELLTEGSSGADAGSVTISNNSSIVTGILSQIGMAVNAPTLTITDSFVYEIRQINDDVANAFGILTIKNSTIENDWNRSGNATSYSNGINNNSRNNQFTTTNPPYFDVTGTTIIDASRPNVGLVQGFVLGLVTKQALIFDGSNPTHTINTIIQSAFPNNYIIRFVISAGNVFTFVAGVGADQPRLLNGDATVVLDGDKGDWIEFINNGSFIAENARGKH